MIKGSVKCTLLGERSSFSMEESRHIQAVEQKTVLFYEDELVAVRFSVFTATQF
jgi:hypothetical protein